MGSTGLTSARHDVFSKYLAEKYPESYDKAVPDELVYSGKLKLTDNVEGSPLDAGKLVLSPTRTYAPVVKESFDALHPEIHGMVHFALDISNQSSALCRRQLPRYQRQPFPCSAIVQDYQGTKRYGLERNVQGIQYGTPS